MEVSHSGSLPANTARRLARWPHLAAQLLRWRNVWRLGRLRWTAAAALAVAVALGLLATPPAAAVLEWLAGSPLVTLAISACLFGLSAVQRRERLRSDAVTSWLAALPVPSSVGLRLLLGAASRLLPVTIFVGLAWITGAATPAAALRLAVATAAGAVVGTGVVGIPLSGGAAHAPGWHYALVRRARPRWATAPSLTPLGYWPLARGRIFSRPSASRVVLLALLAVPAGRTDPGQVALAVAAGSITLFTLLSLAIAAARGSGDAARWLAPTPIRMRDFIGAYLWGPVLKQAAVLAVVLFLACAADPGALRVGSVLVAAYLALSCAIVAIACALACRRVGLGAAGRAG